MEGITYINTVGFGSFVDINLLVAFKALFINSVFMIVIYLSEIL